MTRAACFLLTLPSFAQLQLLTYTGAAETPVQIVYDAGALAAGETREISFRVRNSGSASALVRDVSVSGDGFRMTNWPDWPRTLAPGAFADFRVGFEPRAVQTYSARLLINEASYTLTGRGSATAQLQLWRDSQWQLLTPGAVTPLGSVIAGQLLQTRLRLFNAAPQAILADPPRLSGEGFQLVSAPTAATTLAPGAALEFEVRFQAPVLGPQTATLTAAGRPYTLSASVNPPPPPKLISETALWQSGQEARLRLETAEPAPLDLQGRVVLLFEPAAGLPEDTAIQFVPLGQRFADFRIPAGQTHAQFGTLDTLRVQTGSTAGRIVIRTTLGDLFDEQRFLLEPQAAGIVSVRAVRADLQAEVRITAWDNSRTLAKLAFVFYDRQGRAVSPGRIEADAAAVFREYFAGRGNRGGGFQLRVQFPVTGAAAEIAHVDAELQNGQGVRKLERVAVE